MGSSPFSPTKRPEGRFTSPRVFYLPLQGYRAAFARRPAYLANGLMLQTCYVPSQG